MEVIYLLQTWQKERVRFKSLQPNLIQYLLTNVGHAIEVHGLGLSDVIN